MEPIENSISDPKITSILELRQADAYDIPGEQNENVPHRSIDDFLDELYLAYKLRYFRHNEDEYRPDVLFSDSNRVGEVTTGSPPGRTPLEFIIDCFLMIIRQMQRLCSNGNARSGDEKTCRYQKCIPLPLLALCIANSSDATEILMLSYLLANPSFRREMFADQDGSGSDMEGAEYLASSIFLGMLLGGTVLGFLSDNIGRRPSLLIGLLTNATAGILSSIPFVTPSFVELTIFRFIAGVGIGATVPPLFSLSSEWSPKEIRGSVVTAVASFWMVGSLFVSGVAWCLFHDTNTAQQNTDDISSTWRIFAALCALPSALGAYMVYCLVPESPRFLAAKHDYRKAARSCNQLALALGIPLSSNPTSSIMETENSSVEKYDYSHQHVTLSALHTLTTRDLESSTAIANCDSSESGNNLTSTQRDFVISQTAQSFLGTLRKLYSPQLISQSTLPLQTLWFSLSFGTYGIATWINSLFVAVHLQNLYWNSFLFALANLPGNIISVLYSDKWGRKRMLVSSLVGAAGSLAGFAMLVYFGGNHGRDDGSKFRTNAIVLFACSFQMFSIVSWNTIDILSGELFPTRVRSAGMGVCTASGRLGAMMAQIANAKLMMSSSGSGNEQANEDETIASAWVLVVASSALLVGAGMPLFLGRDASGDELKDDVLEGGQSDNSNVLLGCGRMWRTHKDHLSDEENEAASPRSNSLQSVRRLNEYDSFRQEIEVNEPFLL
eukprot:CCRYP_004919-RA/>CCRYP_004919-RA protein AED:0.09 eAED:0.17 QI:0/0/0/1/1/1/2/0/724